ncbi:hypothetical protein C8Q73DRAFT_834761 [Cubamyces lactineus]|nr:hypothetical protein C8Q73DRAFT_834761 [Cubamyces lactineus]
MPLKKPKADDCWSLSLRGRCTGDDGFSDESDNEDASSQSMPASEESRLLGELDLASRMDAATYKPNPWSIARANAATRTTKPAVALPVKPNRQKNASSNGSVLEMIHKQARKLSTSECQSAVLPATVQKHPSAGATQVSRPPSQSHTISCLEDNAHIPSDETLVDDSYQPHVLHKSGENHLLRPLTTGLGSASSGAGIAVSTSPEAQAGELAIEQPLSRHGQVQGRPSPTTTSGQYWNVRSDAQPGGARNIPQPMIGISEEETITMSKYRSAKDEGVHTSLSMRDAIARQFTPQIHMNPQVAKSFLATPSCVEQTPQRPTKPVKGSPTWKQEWRSPDLGYVNQLHPPFSASTALPKREQSPTLPELDHHSATTGLAITRSIPNNLAFHATEGQSKRSFSTEQPRFSAAQIEQRSFSPVADAHVSYGESLTQHNSPSPPLSPASGGPFPRSAHSRKPPPKRNAYDAFRSPSAEWSTLPAKKTRTGDGKQARGRETMTQKFKVPLCAGVGAAVTARWAREGVDGAIAVVKTNAKTFDS